MSFMPGCGKPSFSSLKMGCHRSSVNSSELLHLPELALLLLQPRRTTTHDHVMRSKDLSFHE